MGQLFLDGAQLQWDRLSKMGDPFVKMKEVINWEIFRNPLETALRKPDYAKGGRPPWDVILMFKITMLMAWYNLSYNQAEFAINDRLSFMRFLGVEVGAKLPDENTIWDFKEAIKDNQLDRELFELFNKSLEAHGLKLNSGSMVDASFVEVPRRRVITEDELKDPKKLLNNQNVKVSLEETETETIVHPNDGKADYILPQVDFEARYTKKNGETFFGYKDHVAVDKDTKFITGYDVTSAEVHDSQVFLQFISNTTNAIWADSAYMSAAIIEALKRYNPDMYINICNRAYRNKPLTDEQKAENSIISKIRARVEHVFGFMTRSMCGMFLNCIGIDRVKRDIGLKNLGYNIKRLVTISFQNA